MRDIYTLQSSNSKPYPFVTAAAPLHSTSPLSTSTAAATPSVQRLVQSPPRLSPSVAATRLLLPPLHLRPSIVSFGWPPSRSPSVAAPHLTARRSPSGRCHPTPLVAAPYPVRHPSSASSPSLADLLRHPATPHPTPFLHLGRGSSASGLQNRVFVGRVRFGMVKPNSSIASSSKTHFEELEREDEEASSNASSEDEDEIERELAEVTFEDLQKARSDGSHLVYRKGNQEKKTGRANKNRPMEVSAKKPVSRFREVVQAPKRVVRDPRFESLCGKLDVNGFRKRYDFLFQKTLPAEKEELKKQLKKTNHPDVVEELNKRVTWIDKQLKLESSAKSSDATILAEHKKKEKEAAKHGKRPFYLKKSEIRKQRLIEKYNNLKASGKLESFIEKRRRKNASKDHKYMPYRRPAEQ